VLLVAHRLWAGPLEKQNAIPQSWSRQLGGFALTYLSVNLGWAFFAMDLETAMFFFQRLLLG